MSLIIRISLIVLVVISPNRAMADALSVNIAKDLAANFSSLSQRLVNTLTEAGFEVNLRTFPNKRSFQMLAQGDVALELIRAPVLAETYPEIVVIEPALARASFQMVTSSTTPEFCDAGDPQFKSMSAAGVIGVDAHAHYYLPRFRETTQLVNFNTALRFVSIGRADVMFLPVAIVESLPVDVKETLTICESKIDEFSLHSILHKDYLWARERIEAAYRAEFSKNK